MLAELTLTAFAFLSPTSADEAGLLVATDQELSTSFRLVETDDAVRFEFSGPDSVTPMIAIDTNRNGAVDRNVDFQVSAEKADSLCLQLLLDETSSTTCKPAGIKARIVRKRGPNATITDVSFPKRDISSDGFGFGFSVTLCSRSGNYCTSAAGGDYQFGGKLSLVTDGPNFKGDRKPDIPQPMLAALRGYQGCVNKAIGKLAPLDRTRAAAVRALPATCGGERSAAFDQGVKALVVSGTDQSEATEMMRSSLDGYDENIERMAEKLEKGG